MADNYLERKMEDLRNGRQQQILHATAQRKRSSVKVDKRRVFVTGGAHGIGRAIVENFRQKGCRVAFCDKDSKAGTALAQGCGARFIPLDVRDAEALKNCMENLFTDWGDIDVIVNNVGVGNFTPLIDTDVNEFKDILCTNLVPVFVTSQCLAKHRKERAYGRIINISSTRATMSEVGTEAYSASKGGIVSLTHALMMSLAPFGITVNSVSPGWIECYDESALRPIDHQFHPSGRVGAPADIARMVAFIASPENDFINGENIVVDGGVTRKMIYPE
jgi:hypothetical protein